MNCGFEGMCRNKMVGKAKNEEALKKVKKRKRSATVNFKKEGKLIKAHFVEGKKDRRKNKYG